MSAGDAGVRGRGPRVGIDLEFLWVGMMMTKKNGTLSVALAAAFLALGATTAGAQVALASSDAHASRVRVINDYHAPVRVYVQGADKRLHHLGRVPAAAARSLTVDAEIAAQGDFRIKIVPEEPAWSRLGEDLGIRSHDITLGEGDVLNFWVERDLMSSHISVSKG